MAGPRGCEEGESSAPPQRVGEKEPGKDLNSSPKANFRGERGRGGVSYNLCFGPGWEWRTGGDNDLERTSFKTQKKKEKETRVQGTPIPNSSPPKPSPPLSGASPRRRAAVEGARGGGSGGPGQAVSSKVPCDVSSQLSSRVPPLTVGVN